MQYQVLWLHRHLSKNVTVITNTCHVQKNHMFEKYVKSQPPLLAYAFTSILSVLCIHAVVLSTQSLSPLHNSSPALIMRSSFLQISPASCINIEEKIQIDNFATNQCHSSQNFLQPPPAVVVSIKNFCSCYRVSSSLLYFSASNLQKWINFHGGLFFCCISKENWFAISHTPSSVLLWLLLLQCRSLVLQRNNNSNLS